jgi:ribosomal protein L31
MRYGRITLTTAMALALIVPTALAGDQGKTEAEKDMTTIAGEVQRVYTRSMDGNEVVMMDIKTEDHPRYTVCIGKKKMDRDKKRPMSLEDGDQVSVTGKRIVRDNGETVFIAHELRHGEQHWKLDHHKDMHRKL